MTDHLHAVETLLARMKGHRTLLDTIQIFNQLQDHLPHLIAEVRRNHEIIYDGKPCDTE